ncbi:hypothetical protein EDB80DRAFT_868738 [Ilyonectria destructans]|nr:hypothetical protein EDB80DRAFT_868738 [Ilyonectria destructans]
MTDGPSHQSALTAEDGIANPGPSFVPVSMLKKFETLRDDLTAMGGDMFAVFETLVVPASQHPAPTSITDNQGSSTSQVTSSATATAPTASEPPSAVADVSDAARAAAARIDELCPKSDSAKDAERFLTSLWEVLLFIARFVPHDHFGQDQLVGVLESLRSRAPTTVRVWGREMLLWGDFPLLSSCMREAWVDPILASEGDEVDADRVPEWVNLNAFAARIMNKGLLHWSVFAVMEIKTALEEELPPPSLVREYTLSVASHWISISGAQLFKDAFTGNTLNETELEATTPGPLYANSGGKPGLCMDRWRFWLSRLAELGNTGVDPRVGLEAIQAAHRMEEIMKQDGQAEAHRLGTAEESRP